ncbi:MAG: hypothetical protein Q4A42_02775 [Tissierellia bacterium]|nr:hypothetical protein [Tissierellia bacterium]
MIGSKLVFGNVELSSKGVVETVESEGLSINPITLARTLKPDVYFGHKRELKRVNVDFTIIHSNMNTREIESKLDKIIGDLHYEGLAELNVNDFTCKAFLVGVKSSTIGNTGSLKLEFINFDGLFYSTEKIAPLNINFTSNSLIDSEKAIIELMPNASRVVVSDSKGSSIILEEVILNKTCTIDLEKMRVLQNNIDVKLDLLSDFFKIRRGTNKIVVNGATGTIKHREVLKL